MYARKRTTGNFNVDRGLDDIYYILNRLSSGGGTSVVASMVPTIEGGFGVYMQNGSGYALQKGALVKGTAANKTVVEATENAYDIYGVVYTQIPVYSFGLIIIFGMVDVLFNSSGASYGHYFRMSKTGDTANVDDGKAHSEDINYMDNRRFLGYPVESRTGEGLARCLLKR